MRQLAPHFDFMGAFREQIARLTAQHFSLAQLKDKRSRLAREMERLANDAPRDTRRLLRRIAEGDLVRVQAPGVEALAARISLDLKRLTQAIALAALVVGGSMLETVSLGGWREPLGATMIVLGLLGNGRHEPRRVAPPAHAALKGAEMEAIPDHAVTAPDRTSRQPDTASVNEARGARGAAVTLESPDSPKSC